MQVDFFPDRSAGFGEVAESALVEFLDGFKQYNQKARLKGMVPALHAACRAWNALHPDTPAPITLPAKRKRKEKVDEKGKKVAKVAKQEEKAKEHEKGRGKRKEQVKTKRGRAKPKELPSEAPAQLTAEQTVSLAKQLREADEPIIPVRNVSNKRFASSLASAADRLKRVHERLCDGSLECDAVKALVQDLAPLEVPDEDKEEEKKEEEEAPGADDIDTAAKEQHNEAQVVDPSPEQGAALEAQVVVGAPPASADGVVKIDDTPGTSREPVMTEAAGSSSLGTAEHAGDVVMEEPPDTAAPAAARCDDAGSPTRQPAEEAGGPASLQQVAMSTARGHEETVLTAEQSAGEQQACKPDDVLEDIPGDVDQEARIVQTSHDEDSTDLQPCESAAPTNGHVEISQSGIVAAAQGAGDDVHRKPADAKTHVSATACEQWAQSCASLDTPIDSCDAGNDGELRQPAQEKQTPDAPPLMKEQATKSNSWTLDDRLDRDVPEPQHLQQQNEPRHQAAMPVV